MGFDLSPKRATVLVSWKLAPAICTWAENGTKQCDWIAGHTWINS